MNDIGFANLAAGDEATDTLMRGFTTVRDVGGPAFGLKRAIDQGIIDGTAHLSVRRHDHRDQRSWRFPPDERPASEARLVHPHGDKRRQHRRGQPRRGAFACPRAVHARGRAAEGDGGRRRVVAQQPARRHHLHLARIAGGRRNCRELGHLRRRARLHAGSDRNVYCSRREVHRARLPDERGRRQADRGKGHLAELAAAS